MTNPFGPPHDDELRRIKEFEDRERWCEEWKRQWAPVTNLLEQFRQARWPKGNVWDSSGGQFWQVHAHDIPAGASYTPGYHRLTIFVRDVKPGEMAFVCRYERSKDKNTVGSLVEKEVSSSMTTEGLVKAIEALSKYFN